jgi:hypothetical protein
MTPSSICIYFLPSLSKITILDTIHRRHHPFVVGSEHIHFEVVLEESSTVVGYADRAVGKMVAGSKTAADSNFDFEVAGSSGSGVAGNFGSENVDSFGFGFGGCRKEGVGMNTVDGLYSPC